MLRRIYEEGYSGNDKTCRQIQGDIDRRRRPGGRRCGSGGVALQGGAGICGKMDEHDTGICVKGRRVYGGMVPGASRHVIDSGKAHVI